VACGTIIGHVAKKNVTLQICMNGNFVFNLEIVVDIVAIVVIVVVIVAIVVIVVIVVVVVIVIVAIVVVVFHVRNIVWIEQQFTQSFHKGSFGYWNPIFKAKIKNETLETTQHNDAIEHACNSRPALQQSSSLPTTKKTLNETQITKRNLTTLRDAQSPFGQLQSSTKELLNAWHPGARKLPSNPS
jgi:hypothetical protein